MAGGGSQESTLQEEEQQPFEGMMGRPHTVVAMAIVVGILVGFVSILFRLMIGGFSHLYFDILAGALPQSWGPLRYLAIPAAGGALVGPIIYVFAREAKGHGIPEVMEAVAMRGGRIRPRVTLIKALASSICIGSGGSVGREGPIVQIGSAAGSTVAQMLKFPGKLTRVMVACGAAAGVAGTFNAPVAGAFFALELILRDWGTAAFAPVVISSFCATVVSRRFLGDHPAFEIPDYSVESITELPLFGLLGLLSALVAIAFIVSLYFMEDRWDRLRIPEWLKPVPGGVLVGALGLLSLKLLGAGEDYHLGIWGVGYDTMQLALTDEGVTPAIVGGLVLLKLAATTTTLGSGGSGGVFAPSLYLGCMTGALMGHVVHTLFPALGTSPAAYALVGMGAVFAAASRAPVTAVLIVYEMTQDYRMILPLMLACAVAVWLASSLYRYSIYNLKLFRRGVHLDLPYEPVILSEIYVGEAMTRDVIGVDPRQTVRDVMDLLDSTKHHGFPLVDERGDLHGIVTVGDVRRALREGKQDKPVSEVATHDVVVAFPEESLNDALRKLALRDVGRLPVVDREDRKKLLGLVTRKNILSAYNRALLHRHTDLEKTVEPEHLE